MCTTVVLLLLSLVCQVCYCDSHTDADLTNKYQFRQQLHDRYIMYWSFDSGTMTVSFAVRVQTTGWIGFGLSPNGQMPGSDVVIGWVSDDGDSFFNDRFAEARSTPPIDESQDWSLVEAEEDNGYTVLEFTRNYYSCDDEYDLNIEEGTSRVVWSFKEQDPPNGADGQFTAHDLKGTRSLNLLGGLIDPPTDPPGTQSFTIEVNNVQIPTNDTTYWCSSFSLSDIIQDFEEELKYVFKVSPEISESSAPYVHHLLVWGCENDFSEVDSHGSACDDASNDTRHCRNGGMVIGAWAVGGEDFVYPGHVALPVGGQNSALKFVVIEMHYDNPNGVSGVIDSSGLRYYYTTTPREYDAGVLLMGHSVTPLMIIPPGAEQYSIFGFCHTSCSEAFPEDGIHVFATILHTHLLGTGVEVMHLRENDSCDGGYEELKPIDRNLHYDFNFQTNVYLREEITILPGDVLVIRCIYNSTRQEKLTLGGESTREEMCVAFLQYYPQNSLAVCASFPIFDNIDQFVDGYVPQSQQPLFESSDDLEAIIPALYQLDWTEDQISGFKSVTHDATEFWYCGFIESISNDTESSFSFGPLPSAGCPYVEPPIEMSCSTSTVNGATTINTTVHLLLLSLLMAALIIL